MTWRRSSLLLVVTLLLGGCDGRLAGRQQADTPSPAAGTAAAATASTGEATTRSAALPPALLTPSQVVEGFGRRLQRVSRLAPKADAARAIRDAYSGIVEPRLLAQWMEQPLTAPGREVSSPWPDRIEADSVSYPSPSTAVVLGAVVEVTSAGESGRFPVRLRLARHERGWLIAAYEREEQGGAGAADSTATGTAPRDQTAAGAAAVVEKYYAAINARDFAAAYRAWGSAGPPGQTLASFTHGFDETATVAVETGPPTRIEPAAGSRFVIVPVIVRARRKDGSEQLFEGTYTLRYSVVDGASESDRVWHIDRAALKDVTARRVG